MKRRVLVLTTAFVLAFSATAFADGEINHGNYKECGPAADGEIGHGTYQECEDGETGHGNFWEDFLKFFAG